VKKYLKLAGIALLVFFIVSRPDPASRMAIRLGGAIRDLADGMGQFVTNIFR
jgi:hypothetical protein